MYDDITLNSSILVVDDSLFILKIIHEMLKGRYKLMPAQSVEKAHDILKEHTPDIILLDLEMPGKNGYDLLEVLKSSPEWKDIPVVFLTGMDDHEKEERALDMGACDYILKPISAGVLKKRIQMHLELSMYQKKLESLVDIKTKQLLKTQDIILDILANATSYRDNDTGAHIIRTTNYSKLIVERLLEIQHPEYMISDAYAHNIIKCAKLHDIGKIAISDGILLKRAKLTPFEFDAIKMHTTFGAQMLDGAIKNLGGDASFLLTAREIVLYHHEWWNGKGYPEHLEGKEIPVSARVMAISDVYDALISVRPYKKAFSHEEAIDIIKSEAGTHFDAVLMDIIDDLLPKFKEVAQAFQDEDMPRRPF